MPFKKNFWRRALQLKLVLEPNANHCRLCTHTAIQTHLCTQGEHAYAHIMVSSTQYIEMFIVLPNSKVKQHISIACNQRQQIRNLFVASNSFMSQKRVLATAWQLICAETTSRKKLRNLCLCQQLK